MIRRLETETDWERFVHFAPEVYQQDPNWVPPDPQHVLDLIRDGGPFAAHCRVQSFLAERNGDVLARVVAVVDDAFNEHWKDALGHLFFFEALHGSPFVRVRILDETVYLAALVSLW